MWTHFGYAAVGLALIAGTQAATAQVVVQDRVVTRPVPLTQAQRTTIYRTIIARGRGRQPIIRERIVTEPVAPPVPVVRERVVSPSIDAYYYGDRVPAPLVRPRVVTEPVYDAYAYAVGERLPPSARGLPMPPAVVAEVPTVGTYRYVISGQRVLLVDPDTGVIVADVTQ